MSIPRRSFLKSATMTTLSAGLALGAAHLIFGQQGNRVPQPDQRLGHPSAGDELDIPIEAQKDQIFYFRSTTFTPYVGDFFQVPNARGEMIALELIRVSEYKLPLAARVLSKKARQPQSFTLTFRASDQLPPFTSIHKVSHPALGKFDLFLTSRTADDGTLLYEAVFNQFQ